MRQKKYIFLEIVLYIIETKSICAKIFLEIIFLEVYMWKSILGNLWQFIFRSLVYRLRSLR